MSIFNQFRTRYEDAKEEEFTLQEYLEICRKDTGAYAHNPHYVIQLLYDSIEDLGQQVSVDMAGMARP